MARANKDVFGFDELEKSFKRFEKNYPDKADALLMAQGQAVNRKTKSLSPVKTKKLRNSCPYSTKCACGAPDCIRTTRTVPPLYSLTFFNRHELRSFFVFIQQ